MKQLKELGRFRLRTLLLLLVPLLNRGANLIFIPFVLNVFGNQGFIKVSILTLTSFLLSVTIELGVKQKMLIRYQARELIITYFAKWIFAVTTFLSICTLLHFFFASADGFIDTRDLIIVIVDAVINVTINSFYLGYLQAAGKSDSILRVNVQCLFLVFVPRSYLLFIGITDPALWVLFGSIFRLLVFANIAKHFRGISVRKQLFHRGTFKLFDAGSLNSIFGLIVVLVLTLDKFVGTHLYDSSTMVAYFLAFQFVSISGSLFEQILIRYFRQIQDSLVADEPFENLRRIIFGFLFAGTILNTIYFAIGVIVFPDLNPIFFPILYLLSFQQLAWGVLILWQNVIGPNASNVSHVRYMGVALVYESLALLALYMFRNLGVVFLAFSAASTFLVCLIGLSNKSRNLGLVFLSRRELISIFALFLVVTLGMYCFRSSIPGVFAISAVVITVSLIRAHYIKFYSKVREITGSNP